MNVAGPAFCWLLQRSADKFMRQTAQFRALSESTLDQILELNGSTAFGRDRGLNGSSARRVFAELPTTTYADYIPYIDRIAAGEQNVMTADPVIFFAMTSGTTGPPKMIPVTRRKRRLSVAGMGISIGLALRAGALNPMRGPFMQIMTEHLSGTTAGGIPKGAATTGGFRQLGGFADAIMSSPADVLRVADQPTSRYLHLLFGLRNEHLWAIASFFPAVILFTIRDLHERAEALLRDLADGTISTDLDLPATVRSQLQRRLRPAPERARGLHKLLEQDRFNVAEIWPDVGCLLTVSGGAFHFYVDQLMPLLGDVPIFSPAYIASEGNFGFGFTPDRPHYLLWPALSYTELLPTESMDDPGAKPIAAWEAEPGRDYEVVITTWGGLVRYRLNDVVRVVEFHGETPVVEFLERRGEVINIVGEKTAEHHIVEAIDTASHLIDEPLVDYVMVPDTDRTPARYLLAIEEWHGDCENNRKARAFVRAVDAALRKICTDYDEECELGSLGPMELVLLRQGAFERLRYKGIAAGRPASQVKTPHVSRDPGLLRHEFQEEVLARISN